MNHAIGLDIGGTKIAAGIVSEKGDLIQKETVHSDPTNKESMFSQVVHCVEELINHSSIPANNICGMGVGIPGKVDRENGIAVFQNNLPWSQFPFRERIKKATGIERVEIDNDVYMAAYAEWNNADMSSDGLFVYITISTGVSCSIIQGGEFIRGAGFAGELGLVPVSMRETGEGMERLERAASGPVIAKKAQKLYGDKNLTTADVFDKYYHGHVKAQKIIEETAFSIAQGIYMLTSIIDPEQIVFGGSVANHNPFLVDLIKNKLTPFLLDEQKHILHGMGNSQLKTDQGIIGAGLRVFRG
ncbi:ROK family protein [Virgibacillus sp. JSM 102003]|uniref:ROK family protein n=1 Tax=Virgibacillus sp. JSM 102003 TaxID=1562108 RepID=UPI0035C03F0B